MRDLRPSSIAEDRLWMSLGEWEQCSSRPCDCHRTDLVALALAPSIEGHIFRCPTEGQQTPYFHAFDDKAARCNRDAVTTQKILNPSLSTMR